MEECLGSHDPFGPVIRLSRFPIFWHLLSAYKSLSLELVIPLLVKSPPILTMIPQSLPLPLPLPPLLVSVGNHLGTIISGIYPHHALASVVFTLSLSTYLLGSTLSL